MKGFTNIQSINSESHFALNAREEAGADENNKGINRIGNVSTCVRAVLYAGSGESETDIWRINRRTHGE